MVLVDHLSLSSEELVVEFTLKLPMLELILLVRLSMTLKKMM
jgi:hypothetical protein